jgi:redox-sensitive bicupin YhaK (pirin superfamily)
MDKEIFRGVAVDEGSGLQMYRVLGTPQLDMIDPLLMLDEFRADRSVPGFPPHPHRGIETVTYLRSGRFRHADSSGNKGILEDGGVQWMRAAGGIIHEEEPLVEAGKPVHGFQLWLNMPRANKRDIPEYEQFSAAEIPVIAAGQSRIKVIAGNYDGHRGPGHGRTTIAYFDVELDAGGEAPLSIENGNQGFIYAYEGSLQVQFADVQMTLTQGDILPLLNAGEFSLTSGRGGNCLFVNGRSLHEPVVKGGPFVMNSLGEIKQAFAEYRNGTFVASKN